MKAEGEEGGNQPVSEGRTWTSCRWCRRWQILSVHGGTPESTTHKAENFVQSWVTPAESLLAALFRNVQPVV